MKSGKRWFFGLAGLMLFITSCCATPKNVFVLMPNPNGTVGQITVQNKGGQQVIAKAGMAVKVQNAKTPPLPPEPMKKQEIEKIFGSAMTSIPLSPVRFNLYFKSGGTKLTDASQALLPKIIATVRKRMPCDIRIIGHTDTVGNAEKNWKLGLKRAERIKGVLVRLGIDPSRIVVASHGEKDLRVPTPDNVSEPKNRYVEILIQ